MGDLVNLRKVRKQAKQEADAKRAAANRILHGRTKAQRSLDAAKAEQRDRHLESHKIDTGRAE